ncbi:MAG: glycosyltransferase family 2 protein [Oscillospiraceae bacterium]|nr:glycosyltransferase family 2 protein [Oscillospiraceae bacterium]
MHYVETVLTVTNALLTLLGVLLAHFIVFAVIGILAKKTYPEREEKLRYGLIIPARNEEAVVAGLIESIRKNDYPQQQLQIFVIAHNCTDRTAQVARDAGATVYEYSNPAENTMGYAFRYLFSKIEADYGTQSFDGFFLFNADNVLDRQYLSRMNDAFLYYDKTSVITSYRNSKNFGANLLSGLYGMYFAVGCLMESRGRTVAGCATRVQGTGYLIPARLVEHGWKYVTLTEDWEFTGDNVWSGTLIRYCDDAIFYDEQPTSLRIMWRQRVRWARGHLIVFFTHFRTYFRAIFRRETRHRFSLYDITMYLIPSVFLSLALQLLQYVLLLFAPLADSSCSLREIFLNPASGVLFALLRSTVFSYVSTVISAVLVFVIERKRIRQVTLPRKILIALTWPLFLAIQFPIDVQAVFSRNLGWKPIPHNDRTSFEEVNK